jgi:hypothetical protein
MSNLPRLTASRAEDARLGVRFRFLADGVVAVVVDVAACLGGPAPKLLRTACVADGRPGRLPLSVHERSVEQGGLTNRLTGHE